MKFAAGCLALYFTIGAGLALYSGTHPVFFTLLWPWALAAELVRKVTGEYPPWTPWL